MNASRLVPTVSLSAKLTLGVMVLAVAACSSDTPAQPTPPAAAPVLTAPVHDVPADDQQLSTLQPELRVVNSTSTPNGARIYQFQVSATADFASPVASAQSVAEGSGGKTTWTPPSALQPTTRFWWRARAVQGTAEGPWSTPTRFRSKVEGYNLPGELFDPLTGGSTVGAAANVTFEENGAVFPAHQSLITYLLPQSLPQGEFSMHVTGLTTNSPGDKTKVFSMQQAQDDLTENIYRATVEKRSNGEISFRFIAGDLDARADSDRIFLTFNPSMVYLWKLTWEAGRVRLLIIEDAGTGRTLFDQTDTYGGTYRPNPHYAYVGAPSGRSGPSAATVPGMVVRNVWLSSRARPAGLGSALLP